MSTSERYQLFEELGRGGMGVVYRAHDTQLGRDVALKLLPAVLAEDETTLLRFQREAQLIAQLEHAHIVPIYDVGVREKQPFLVMRLLRGGSLHDLLRKKEILPSELWKILHQIGDALDVSHAQHIIHRDIKPSNILFDEQGQAYLTDFGIAKALDATTQYTGNSVIGSPAYMSPEHFTGEDFSGRTDQYSLAIVAFEVLAGQLPFQGNTAKVMYGHLQKPPPAIHMLKTDLPVTVNDVLHRALAKAPSDRYETIQEFVMALQNAADLQEQEHPFAELPSLPVETTQAPEIIQSAEAQQNLANEEFDAQPPVSLPPAPSLIPSIVRGAGGTQSTFHKRRPTNQIRWLIIGGIVFAMSVVSLGVWLNTPNPTSPSHVSASTNISVAETGAPVLAADAQFAAEVYPRTGSTYRVVAADLAEVVQGDIVVLTSDTPVTIQTRFITQVVLSRDTLAGIRYDTGNQQFIVHCLRGRCVVKGDVSGETALTANTAVMVGSSGTPNTPFVAQYDLFSFATDVVPTPTPVPDTSSLNPLLRAIGTAQALVNDPTTPNDVFATAQAFLAAEPSQRATIAASTPLP